MSNARAARRRAAKDAAKNGMALVPNASPADHVIQLQNPVQQHFEQFLAANAAAWQTRAAAEMEGTMPEGEYEALLDELGKHKLGSAYLVSKKFHDMIDPFAQRYVVQPGEAHGQHLVIAGAGPSLREHAAEYCGQADQVWGCNSAAIWLHDQGYKVTHAFTVDQTAEMAREWESMPEGLEYLLATTCHPGLVKMLWDHDRTIRFFNNFCGIRQGEYVQWPDENGVQRRMGYEEWLYAGMFPGTFMAGSGLNAVTRAIDVARVMGFAKVTVLGADCCLRVKEEPPQMPFGSPEHLDWLRENTEMHADGGHALASEASPLTIQATIDGRFWMTKVDMVLSAQWLVRMANAWPDFLELVGDTLPNALKGKDEAFLQRLPNFVTPDGRIANIPTFRSSPAVVEGED